MNATPSIIPLGNFDRRILKLIDREEYELLKQLLVQNPHKGYLIQGTGGVRGFRHARDGGGKSGGFRVIYYFADSRGVIYLIDVYAKNEKSALTKGEKNELRKFIKELE